MNLTRHEQETDRNAAVWRSKPLLREIYRDFHQRIERSIGGSIPGRVVEIGSGIGNFAEWRADVLTTDRWLEPWLDLTCDAYRLPFRPGAVSHLVLFDVFHHLASPAAFFGEAARVMAPGARVIVLEPFISAISTIAYGLFHPEPIGWRAPLSPEPVNGYYAAQGNATRLFFRDPSWLRGWSIVQREVWSSFAYLLSGGFSRPALYPRRALNVLRRLDGALSHWPRVFGARCLVVLTRDRSSPRGHP